MDELDYIILDTLLYWLMWFTPIFALMIFSYLFLKKRLNFSLKIIKEFGIYLIIMIISFIFSAFLINERRNYSNMNTLLSYDPAIEYLQDYKTKHGKYPEKLDFEKFVKNRFEFENYETKDKSEEYILRVSESEYLHAYYYCSNKKYKECYPHVDNPVVYTDFGKWIEYENYD